jgi:hypothetical protein
MITVATGESDGEIASPSAKAIRIGAGPMVFEIRPSSHWSEEREKIGIVPAFILGRTKPLFSSYSAPIDVSALAKSVAEASSTRRMKFCSNPAIV